jgi:hypothetical protein
VRNQLKPKIQLRTPLQASVEGWFDKLTMITLSLSKGEPAKDDNLTMATLRTLL